MSVPTSPDFNIHYLLNLADPFPTNSTGRNNYRIFCDLKDRHGVYIFFDKCNRPLYVGEAPVQSLKERITQNYTANDSGGTFRKNWCKKNRANFASFKKELEEWQLIIISVKSKDKKKWIHVLEAVMIGFLDPEYNK